MLKISVKNSQNSLPLSKAVQKNIKRITCACLRAESMQTAAEITFLFVTNARIKKLNALYLKKNTPTDVIAFNISRGVNFILADIVISAEKALQNSRIYKTDELYELYLYAAHGVLHILGFSDKNKKERKIMQTKAQKILTALKLNAHT